MTFLLKGPHIKISSKFVMNLTLTVQRDYQYRKITEVNLVCILWMCMSVYFSNFQELCIKHDL